MQMQCILLETFWLDNQKSIKTPVTGLISNNDLLFSCKWEQQQLIDPESLQDKMIKVL